LSDQEKGLPIENEADAGDTQLDLNDVAAVGKALDEERERAEQYLANWQRSQADMINFKKRTEHERLELFDYASAELIKEILPVIDDLERALSNVPCETIDDTWVDGVGLIYRKLMGVLQSRGLTRIECEGEDFDPNLHEAVMCVDGDEGKVVEELQRGYRFRDRVIRPSMCKVGKSS